jgi:hypothetical protein
MPVSFSYSLSLALFLSGFYGVFIVWRFLYFTAFRSERASEHKKSFSFSARFFDGGSCHSFLRFTSLSLSLWLTRSEKLNGICARKLSPLSLSLSRPPWLFKVNSSLCYIHRAIHSTSRASKDCCCRVN